MNEEKKELTKKGLVAKIAALGSIEESQKKEIICTLIGHSKIVSICFGQVTCGRCNCAIGDTLMGSYDMTDKVLVGHKCPTCIKNFAALTWRDKYRAAMPFPATTDAKPSDTKRSPTLRR